MTTKATSTFAERRKLEQVPAQTRKTSAPVKVLIGGFSVMVTLVTILLPWRLRYRFSFFLARTSFWLMKRSDCFYKWALKAKFVGMNEATWTKLKKAHDPLLQLGEDKREVALLFSGGSDSTLAAIHLLEEFERVHLLTFDHDAIPDKGMRSFASADRLRQRFGEERVVHKIINIQGILDKVYRKSHLHDLKRYGLFEVNICAACKLSMYLATVKYCLENNLSFAASGANKDGRDLISDQMVRVSEILEDFFRRQGITYLTPVYDVDRSDWELFDYGITEERDTKARAARSANTRQAYCENSFPYTIYAKGYHVLRYGQKSLENTSVRWYKEKIAQYEERVPDIVCDPGEEPYRKIVRFSP